jgi:Helix-turn-helix domain
MLTLRDAAKVAGMRRSTIKHAIRQGLLPRSREGFDRGHPYRINAEDLLRFARDRTKAKVLPEATQYGLPFAFIEMVRERTKSQRPTSRA